MTFAHFPAWGDASWTSQKQCPGTQQLHVITELCSTRGAHPHQLLLAADIHTNCNFCLQKLEINANTRCHVDLHGSVHPTQAFRNQQRKIRKSRPQIIISTVQGEQAPKAASPQVSGAVLGKKSGRRDPCLARP